MKNIVLGVFGCLIAIYTVLSCLSIYSISARKNEMENCVSQVLEQNLKKYYRGEHTDVEVEAFVRQDLLQRMYSDSKPEITIRCCDMTNGMISVHVTESFGLPGGYRKSVSCDKTIIVESETVEETESMEGT